MSINALYLNKHGSRWIMADDKGRVINKVMFERDGSTHTRKAIHFGMWGNHSYARVSYKGKLTDILEFKLC